MVAEYLSTHGFNVHSLSDVVREEATRLRLEHTRDNLIETGNRIRSSGGPGALAQRILPRLVGRHIVDSIRNPGEVQVLRGLPRFLLLGIDAPQELRFERSMKRGRIGDGATLGEFAEKERRENSTTEAGQQLLSTLNLADAVIQNDRTIEELYDRICSRLAALGVAL